MISWPESQTYISTPFSRDEMKDVQLLALYLSYDVSYEDMGLPTDVAPDLFCSWYLSSSIYNMIPGTRYELQQYVYLF